MELSTKQLAIIESPLENRIFLSGPAGSGKTTVGIERLKLFLQNGCPGHEILLLFPQRNLSLGYLEALEAIEYPGSSKPAFATFGGLARRGLDLFWPLIKNEYPSFTADTPPIFLTLESSLYFLSKIIEPLLLEKGYFASVTLQRNRLYSQILDNLNKSAVHGFPHTDISERLLSSWIGDSTQALVFEHAQISANLFREFCYAHNLLDFSLQVELFSKSLKAISQLSDYYRDQYKYLIYDNIEEDIPVCHDFVSTLLPCLDSSIVIFDEDAGYRSFLGASPSNALGLKEFSDYPTRLSESFTTSKTLGSFNSQLSASLLRTDPVPLPTYTNLDESIVVSYQSSYPLILKTVTENISDLIKSGISPSEIVVLAPFLSDALRFMFTSELEKMGISSSTHRPSRALRDEPVTHCLLTLAAFAHPQWDIHPSSHDLSFALLQTIHDLDLTRAYLLSKQALKNQPQLVKLANFDSFPSPIQDRITFYFGDRYQELLNWLLDYAKNPPIPLDHFYTHLFGEILSQPGFGFHEDISKATIVNQIIQSVQKFRGSAGVVNQFSSDHLGIEYYKMVKTGVLANQYLQSWTQSQEDSIYLAPAYTFLLNNRPVEYQFWLDVGSRGWYERIFQPLTNPHVLHRDWQTDTPWRDIEEHQQNLANLDCLTTGLVRRCKKMIVFCLTDTDEHGYEQKGLLIQAVNDVLNSSRDAK